MSILVVGISHRSATMDLMDQVALDADGVAKLLHDVLSIDHVTEVAVISTCNRVEIYADVERFHGSVEELSRLISRGTEFTAEQMVPHLYVHYDDGAVSHLFRVAAGLDSMIVGESQVLGQVREGLRVAQEMGAAGPSLNTLFQQSLRVGKRTHAETDIDRAAPSLVSAALEMATERLDSVAGRNVLIVGAGAMAGLAAATVSRLGADSIAVANRSTDSAERLAREYAATTVGLGDVPAHLGAAEIVVSCTGATEVVLSADDVRRARQAAGTDRPLVIIDLALPHDVDRAVADLDGVSLVSLRELSEALRTHAVAEDITAVREIVTEEVQAFLAARRQAKVTPTVVALRSMATEMVDAELARLSTRIPGLDATERDEVETAMRRVADKLLHQPTVRVRELADSSGAVSYAAALAELFALDPDAVDAVTRVVAPGGDDA